MADLFSSLIEFIKLYNNNTALIVLFLSALAFLWIVEKDTNIRSVFVYMVTIITVIFLCPVYFWVALKIDDEVYYRVFWVLPIGIMVAYSGVRAVIYFKNVFGKILVSLIVVIVICINGKFVYTNTLHFKASNPYHIPQLVIDVADSLKMDKYKPNVVMPRELIPFFRQYSCDVISPYGRNVIETSWVEKWNASHELYEAMEADVYDTALIAEKARKHSCIYVVLSSAKQQLGSMEEQGYFLKDFAGGYFIYMDSASYDYMKVNGMLSEDEIVH